MLMPQSHSLWFSNMPIADSNKCTRLRSFNLVFHAYSKSFQLMKYVSSNGIITHVYLTPTGLLPFNIFSILPWFQRNVLHNLSRPGSITCGLIAGWLRFPSSMLLPVLKPNIPGLGSLLSSASPMKTILFTFPPKVLLGLNPPTSLLLLIESVSFLFLNNGISLFSSGEKAGGGFWIPIESTYCATSSKLLLSFESSCANLFHSVIAGSVFLRLGRKIFSTNVRKTEMSLLSAMLNKRYKLKEPLRFQLASQSNHFTRA